MTPGEHVMTTAITVSERAARRIGEILKTEGDGAMLRISVEGGGCSGFLAGSEVDFVDDLIGASFRVVNPNATASCGCGTSFSI
jgi:Fe-S cluster assembly iron-binding protein IscA